MSRLSTIKNDLIDDVLTFDELESYMSKYDFVPYENEDEESADGVIKFTNYKSMIWIEGTIDEDNCILVHNVKNVTKFTSESNRVKPFKDFNDLIAVQNAFKEKGQYDYWLAGWLCGSIGRRCGDIMSLKWDDLYLGNGKFREALPIKEQKTGKQVGAIINDLAREKVEEYIQLVGVDPMENYHKKIFSKGYESFRQALQKVVNEVGIDYPISTHSYRKFYANTNYKLHPQDDDRLVIIQTEMGHSDVETTKIYIGLISEKIEQYNKDYAEYVLNKENGIDVEINNSPVVSVRADDYRSLLGKMWELCQAGTDKFNAVNQIIGMTEEVMCR